MAKKKRTSGPIPSKTLRQRAEEMARTSPTDFAGPHIVFVNDAMCQLTGHTAEELIAQSPRVLQGDDSNRETLDRIKAELSAGRSVLAEVINYRKDGTPYDAELFITPMYNAEGRRTNFVSVHRDITERKRADQQLRESTEQLRAVLNTAADAIITIEQCGIINGVNAATERMFGYAHRELIGRNVSILMPAPYRDEHDEYIKRYLETGEAHIIGIGREVVGRRKDGSTFPVGLAVSEIDHPRLFTGIIRDISEQRKLQRDVVSIAEDEQRRIGQDLHDSTQQELAGLGMLAQSFFRYSTFVRPRNGKKGTCQAPRTSFSPRSRRRPLVSRTGSPSRSTATADIARVWGRAC